MTISLFSTLLYLPFLVLSLIIGFFYLRSGYKRGLWHALISFSTTLIVTLLSVIFANVSSGILSDKVIALIPEDVFQSMGPLSNFVCDFAAGILQVILSFFLFGFVFFLLLIVLKFVANRLSKRFLPDVSESPKWFRFSGLTIRLVDTVVVAILFLLPLYAALSSTVAPLANIVKLFGETEQIAEYADCINEHPTVVIYRKGPAAWVVQGLARFEFRNSDLNLSKMADTVNTLFEQVNAIKNKTGEERILAIREFTEFAKEDLIEEPWCYDLMVAVKEDMEKQISDQITEEADRKRAQELFNVLDATQEEFTETVAAVLDFTGYLLEHNLENSEEDSQTFTDETYEKLGTLLNQSKQTAAAKRLLIRGSLEDRFAEAFTSLSPSLTPSPDEAKKEAEAFMEKYFPEGSSVAKADQKKEAEAFFMMVFASDDASFEEGLRMHPLFGDAAAEELIQKGILLSIPAV